VFGLAEEIPSAVNSAPTPRMLGGPGVGLGKLKDYRSTDLVAGLGKAQSNHLVN
jgi:hypothetical protein